MARLGPSATSFSKTSAGSFDGLWSTPATGFQAAKPFLHSRPLGGPIGRCVTSQ